MKKRPRWSKGEWSDELSGPENKRAKILIEAVGRNLICDDGVERYCHEIVNSLAYPHMAIVNENDPKSHGGHFITLYSLAAQVLGEPLPDRDAIEAWKRTAHGKYKDQDDRWERIYPKAAVEKVWDQKPTTLWLPRYLRK